MPKTKKTKRSGAVVYVEEVPSDDSDFDVDDLPLPAGKKKKVAKPKLVDFIDLSLSSPESEKRETRSKKKEKEVKIPIIFPWTSFSKFNLEAIVIYIIIQDFAEKEGRSETNKAKYVQQGKRKQNLRHDRAWKCSAIARTEHVEVHRNRAVSSSVESSTTRSGKKTSLQNYFSQRFFHQKLFGLEVNRF